MASQITRIGALVFALIVAPLATWGQATFRQRVGNSISSYNQPNVTVAIAPFANPSTLVAEVDSACVSLPPTLTDTLGSSWVFDAIKASDKRSVSFFHAGNSSLVGRTVKATFQGGGCSYPGITIRELTCANGCVLDGGPISNAENASASTTLTIGTINATIAGDFLIAAIADNNGNNALTCGGGWFCGPPTTTPSQSEDRVASGVGAQSVAMSIVAKGYSWAGMAVAYKNAGGVQAQPPTIVLAAPTVSGTVGLTANVSDNVPITSVQYLLDGVALGAAITTSPYNLSWNTATASNGAHTITAKATNSAGQSTTSVGEAFQVSNGSQQASGQGQLAVAAATVPLTMSASFTMPPGTVGTAYSANVGTVANVQGGVPPYSYALTAGSLPAGLTLSSAGMVTGTPTTAGTSNFTVTVTDSSGSARVIDMSTVVGQ